MAHELELAVVNAQNAVEIFTGGGMRAMLDGIELKVRAIKLDPSTAGGREEIRSVAYRIARTKAALDAEGKKLTEGWRDATTKVNAERKKSAERLESLQEEIRKPLTEFENKEKIRVAAHEQALLEITGMRSMLESNPDMGLDLLLFHQQDLLALLPGYVWEEFSQRAMEARGQCEKYLSSRIESRKKYEVEQEELAALRRAELQRQQRERDERLKTQAAEAAREESERKAKAEAERVRIDAERARSEIENARRQEEVARIAAEKRALDAEEAARLESQKAVAKERARVESERKAFEDARIKREADQRLRENVRSEIVEDLTEKSANEIADAIMAGEIRHVRVVF